MKLAFLLTVLTPLIVFGQIQNKVKVLNGLTHKPLKDICCYLLKDNDKWIDIGKTNKKGIFTTHLNDLDSTATYLEGKEYE